MAHLVVEFEFDAPVSEDVIERNISVLRPCLDVRNVRKLGSVVSADRMRGFCMFEAPDAETVREMFRSAHVPFKSVWPARFFDFALPRET
jgi:hypothetical protein